MSKVTIDISMSLDGYIAGPDQTLEQPLGEGGERLHDWALATAGWRSSHGLSGGESNIDSDVMDESLKATGATIMGRRMYSGGRGSWEDDPNADGWWGDDPPFHHPVFVLTHQAREPRTMKGGTTFTFVTEGPEAALERAQSAAAGANVAVAGGANTICQYLNAGLVDELQIHLAPVLLGSGVPLFDEVETEQAPVELIRTIAAPTVTHVKYRIAR
ncbi:MAG: dihydrofolate reductase family protein [Actinomycetota bacterium]